METSIEREDSASVESSCKDSINWNKIATIIATVAVLFFFTRSAPFPSSTFWELTIARDFDENFARVLFPETISLFIADSGVSLLGLKAIYHIIYFVLCSLLSIWVFKNKETLPGLLALTLFSFSMQSYLNLRMLLTLTFILGILYILDLNRVKDKHGIIFIPILAAASGLGLNTLLFISLILCHALCNKQLSLTVVLSAMFGGVLFPDGLVASLDPDSIFNWNFMPNSDLEILYLLSGIFLLVNLLSLGRISRSDVPNLLFYAITGFFALIAPTTIPAFVFMGVFLFIKLYSDQKPLALNFQMFGLLVITSMVYLYLFVNPFGIKLNPSVKNQIGKDLAPLMDGYVNNLPIERHNLGELAWKGMIRYDQERIRQMYYKEDLVLLKTANDEFKVIQPKKQQESAVSF